MKAIRLTCEAYYSNRKYHATAADEQGNKYNVSWNVFFGYDPETDELEDACDWEYPSKILTTDGKDVTDSVTFIIH